MAALNVYIQARVFNCCRVLIILYAIPASSPPGAHPGLKKPPYPPPSEGVNHSTFLNPLGWTYAGTSTHFLLRVPCARKRGGSTSARQQR
jgi:hypothetical protein